MSFLNRERETCKDCQLSNNPDVEDCIKFAGDQTDCRKAWAKLYLTLNGIKDNPLFPTAEKLDSELKAGSILGDGDYIRFYQFGKNERANILKDWKQITLETLHIQFSDGEVIKYVESMTKSLEEVIENCPKQS